MTVIRTKTKRKRGLSPFAFAFLQRIALAQQASGSYVTPADVVPPGSRRDWITLQSLLGRGMVGMCEDGRIRVTADGWRRLKGNRG